MSNTLSKIMLFMGGAAVGSAITFLVVRDKYEKMLSEEINYNESHKQIMENQKELKEILEEVYPDKENTKPEEGRDLIENDELTYDPEAYQRERAKNEAFNKRCEEYAEKCKQYQNGELEDEEEDDGSMTAPYVISPDEFGDLGYEMVYLSLYADGVVAYDDDNSFMDEDDVNMLLGGDENLDQMGKFEPDILHIRNENEYTDYEITRDLRKYSEVN